MTERTEFHSIHPVLEADLRKKSSAKLKGEYSNYRKLAPADIASNTNAKTPAGQDKLRRLFRDRSVHKSLSEQKVNDWLYRNRSFYESVPSDLIEIPDAIWAPPDGTRNNNTKDEVEGAIKEDSKDDTKEENATGNNAESLQCRTVIKFSRFNKRKLF